jgi:hypothetical protein
MTFVCVQVRAILGAIVWFAEKEKHSGKAWQWAIKNKLTYLI